MLRYIALVSHDDESEMIPLGLAANPRSAKRFCEQHTEEQDPPDPPIEWNEGEGEPHVHDRIAGEFWTGTSYPDGYLYTYYVRPVNDDLSRAFSKRRALTSVKGYRPVAKQPG